MQIPPARPAKIHEELFKLNSPLIVTTNHDTLLEDAYAKMFRQSALTWTQTNAADVSNYLHTSMTTRAPAIFKIHGSVLNPPSIVLTQRDYAGL